jgi:hypothetical protein
VTEIIILHRLIGPSEPQLRNPAAPDCRTRSGYLLRPVRFCLDVGVDR